MGVYSDGSYNVPAGLIYSFPVTCANGDWKIVQGKDVQLFQHATWVSFKLIYIHQYKFQCQLTFYLLLLGLSIDEFSRKKLDLTAEELSEEKTLAYSCLSQVSCYTLHLWLNLVKHDSIRQLFSNCKAVTMQTVSVDLFAGSIYSLLSISDIFEVQTLEYCHERCRNLIILNEWTFHRSLWLKVMFSCI